MSDAQEAKDAALNARCAASPCEAANFAALLRRTPRAVKEDLLFNSAMDNLSTLVRILLADGLSANTVYPDRGDATLLHAASKYGSLDVLRLLLEAGADSIICDWVGNTPLVEAILHGQLACARELIPHTNLRIF